MNAANKNESDRKNDGSVQDVFGVTAFSDTFSTVFGQKRGFFLFIGLLIGVLCTMIAVYWPATAEVLALVLIVIVAILVLVSAVSVMMIRHKLNHPLEEDVSADLDGDYIDELMSEDASPKRLALSRAIALIAVDRQLTTREREVLIFLVRGRDVRHISNTLMVSVNTVRTHIQNIYNKLGVHSRQELIDYVESYAHESVDESTLNDALPDIDQ